MGNTMKVMEGHNLPYIPYDILVNILKRLPVKSLIRFQCVCKDWKNLFKSPSFVQDHLHHSTDQNALVLVTGKHHIMLCDLGNDFLDFHKKKGTIEIQKTPLTHSSFHIVASSNGLACANVDNGNGVSLPQSLNENGIAPSYLLLWNPATREFKKLPGTNKDFNGDYSLGFGFTPIDNDYKILRIYATRSSFYSAVNPVEVYSLNSGSWNEIEFENLEGTSISRWGNVTVNGVMYWFGGTQNDDDYRLVVSIDLTRQVCTLIPLSHLEHSFSKRLVVYENKLAMVVGNQRALIHLWVMEEDTSESSWGRWIWAKNFTNSLCSITPVPRVAIWRKRVVFRPFFYGGNDDGRQYLCMLDVTTNEFQIRAVIEHGFGNIHNIYNHVESLVTIGSINNE